MKVSTTVMLSLLLVLVLGVASAWAGYLICDDKGCKYCTVSENGTVFCY